VSEIQELKNEIRAFADARNWEVFHTPKNLSMAIAGEAGELVAEFQWLTMDESMRKNLTDKQIHDIKLEIADVSYLSLPLNRCVRCRSCRCYAREDEN